MQSNGELSEYKSTDLFYSCFKINGISHALMTYLPHLIKLYRKIKTFITIIIVIINSASMGE